MRPPKKRYILAGLAVIIILAVTLVPMVPYALQVNNPGFPYELQGYRTCSTEFAVNQSLDVGNPAFQRCIAPYLIPPINVTGYGSLSYRLLGIGDSPFPTRFVIGETDFYAILYTDGANVAAAQEVSQDNVTYDPAGIAIVNSSLSQGFFGNSNVTVTVANHSDQTLIDPVVFVSVPGSSGNYTDKKGITWIFSLEIGSSASEPLQFQPCLTNGVFNNLTSGASCTAVLHPVLSAPFGSPFRYTVEVTGRLGSTPSVTKQTYSYLLSAQAANRVWVNTFIRLVNAARGSPDLAESGTLDRFAEQRFNTAAKQPDISDYGLSADVSSFLGSNTSKLALTEVLLFPNIGTQSPYAYVNLLQGSARGHWAALTNKSYTHFGFYIGSGPYVSVNLPCPVTEIPQAGINITQYFTNLGCSVSRIPSTTWLVMILSN